jgi:hypothetical protein
MKHHISHALARLSPIAGLADVRSISRRAMYYAHSGYTDEEAAARLRKDVGTNIKAARTALAGINRARSEFDGDRAFRLLDAVVREVPVEAAPIASSELFAREEELGRLPLDEARAKLIALEPRLSSLWTANATRRTGDDVPGQIEHVNSLVGPGSENSDPLLRSQLALSVMHHVLATTDGDLLDTRQVSYFSAPRKRVVRAGSI